MSRVDVGTAGQGQVIIRGCQPAEFDDIRAVVHDAAIAYRGVIAADRWKDPYMSEEESVVLADARWLATSSNNL